jgi:hypothetical protein
MGDDSLLIRPRCVRKENRARSVNGLTISLKILPKCLTLYQGFGNLG